MNSKKIEEALNEQIKNEEHSSRIYMAMASWCEIKGYRGAANFLYKQSDEERMHMLKLVHYVNDRGGYARLSPLEVPVTDFSSLKDVFEQVLKHEVFISESINKIYGLCMEEKDYTTGNFLQWYINEQIEEESTMHEILDKINLVGNDKAGMFHIDKELENLAAVKVV
ncbi:non-heme ferritin [Lentimicrobium sp.]